MISNISELVEYYNKYDYSCYIVESLHTALYVAPGLPTSKAYDASTGEFYDDSPTTLNLLSKSIYIRKVFSIDISTYTIGSNNEITTLKSLYDKDNYYQDCIEINLTTGESILIQPNSIKYVEDNMKIYIPTNLPLSELSISNIKMLKIDYVYPIEVSDERIVNVGNFRGTLYKITNSCYNNTVITNAYGVGVLKSPVYLTKESADTHYIFTSTKILSNTIKRDYYEISQDTKIISNQNKIIYEVRDANLPFNGLLITKNGKHPDVAPSYTKNKIAYIQTPLITTHTAVSTYQYPIRTDVYSTIEKIKLQEYNYNELVQQMQFSDTKETKDIEDYTGSSGYNLINKTYNIEIDFLSDNMKTFTDSPKQLLLIRENYIWDV